MIDKRFKQGKLLLESEQIILKERFEKIHIREEELKDKEKSFEEMHTTMFEEFRKIGEASETFKICEDDVKEKEDIFETKEIIKKQNLPAGIELNQSY